MKTVSLAILVFTSSTLAAVADPEHGVTTRPITDGTFHRKAGSSRMMLTLADMTIVGAFNGCER